LETVGSAGSLGPIFYEHCRSDHHQGLVRLAAIRDMERIGVCQRAARSPGENSRFALIPAGAFFHRDDLVRALGRRHLVSRDDRVAARILKTVIASEAKQSSFFVRRDGLLVRQARAGVILPVKVRSG
jgi:hypothetical protein